MKLFSTVACGALLSFPAVATATDLLPRDIPAKVLPARTADISPGMQAFVGPLSIPTGTSCGRRAKERARAFANGQAAATVETIRHAGAPACQIRGRDHRWRSRLHPHAQQRFHQENKDKVLIHLHGGCYVLNPSEAGLPEALLMAGFGHFKVVAVDYRMPPAASFLRLSKIR